jgi:hypothetical protein
LAHAWRISPNTIGFNLDEGEETLLMAAYLSARDKIGNQTWLIEFEERFLQDDKGVSDRVIGMFNGVLKASGTLKQVVKLSPTAKTAYMTTRGLRKIESRQAILDDLQSKNGRAGRRLSDAFALVAAQPAPNPNDAEEQSAMFD